MFVVFEGIDGSGKTLQAYMLAARWVEEGKKVLVTEEPCVHLPTGLSLKMILRSGEKVPVDAMAMLFAADRKAHVENIIRPALDRGVYVISDRYYYSSLAYQMDVPRSWLEELNRGLPEPDFVFLLDIDPRVALERLEVRGTKSLYEKLNYLERVRENYLRLAEEKGFIVLDASESPSRIHKGVIQHLRY